MSDERHILVIAHTGRAESLEAITRGTGTIEIRSGSAAGPVVESFNAATSGQVSVSGSTLTIDPTNNLAAGTQYFVVLPSGAVRDIVGNAYAGTSTYDFTTVPPSDTTAPTVTTFAPADGATPHPPDPARPDCVVEAAAGVQRVV